MNRRVPEGRKVLALGEGCEVELCAHGVVHVTVGAITAHLTQHAFATVCETLSAALWELGIDSAGSSEIPVL